MNKKYNQIIDNFEKTALVAVDIRSISVILELLGQENLIVARHEKIFLLGLLNEYANKMCNKIESLEEKLLNYINLD